MKHILHVLIASCSTSNNVVSNFGIQKRKYTKGWFVPKSKVNAIVNENKTTKIKVNQFSKKEEVIEKITPKTQLVPTAIKNSSIVISHNNQIAGKEKIKKQTQAINFVNYDMIKPLQSINYNKSKVKSIKKEYREKHILIKIGLVILAVGIIFGILGLLLYLSTLSIVLAYIFGILIGIISALITLFGIIGLIYLDWGVQFGMSFMEDFTFISGWLMILLFLFVLVILLFTTTALILSPILITVCNLIIISFGFALLTLMTVFMIAIHLD